MKLVDAYTHPEAVDLLWRLLAEREPHQSISHRAMPTPANHRAFILSAPYPHWYVIDCGDLVGAAYLTDRREVGISILRQHRGHQYARNALLEIMRMHPGPLLANINPANGASIRLFAGLGFRHIQNTYRLEAR
jgi:RimJ/RimL family protein N-acetyltransferase